MFFCTLLDDLANYYYAVMQGTFAETYDGNYANIAFVVSQDDGAFGWMEKTPTRAGTFQSPKTETNGLGPPYRAYPLQLAVG
jgi:hypothetical protein